MCVSGMGSGHDPTPPSHHLLRTLAAVPVSNSVLDLGCGHGRHTEPLLRLGFPVHACDPRPAAVESTRERVQDLVDGDVTACVQVSSLEDVGALDASFNWIVADRAEVFLSTREDLTTLFKTARHLLVPGGWLFFTLPAEPDEQSAVSQRDPVRGFSEPRVDAARDDAGLAVAQELDRIETGEGGRWRGLYRRVEPDTPG